MSRKIGVDFAVINMVPGGQPKWNFNHPTMIQRKQDKKYWFEEYGKFVNVTKYPFDPQKIFDELNRHIAPGRIVKTVFEAVRNNGWITVYFISIDGGEIEMWVMEGTEW